MDVLSDDEVWNRLHHALLTIGQARGATGFGASTLDSARVALTSLQMALLCEVDQIAPANAASLQRLVVLLPPEALADLEAFILRHPTRYTVQEAVAFLLAESLARRKLWLTGPQP